MFSGFLTKFWLDQKLEKKMNTRLLRRIAVSCFGVMLAFAMLSGCGRSTRNSDRQSRFGSGLMMSARIINLPSADEGRGAIVFVAELRYPDLQFVKTNDGYVAEAELTFSLKAKDHPEQVRLADRRRKIDLKDFAETVDREKVLRVVEQMAAPVGEYTASVVGFDRYARSQSLISQPLRVNDFLSGLHLVAPILTWDSLATFQPDNMIPLRQRRFARDFYALVFIGGLQTGREVALQYELQDPEGKRLFNRSLQFTAPLAAAYTSLRIPFTKLNIGTTILKVSVEQNAAQAEASLPIYANVGITPKQGQSLATLIDPMRYIMDGKEWQKLKDAGPDERTKIFQEFWAARQPLPGQPLKGEEENPLLAEFFLRVEEANARFYWTKMEGWQTDRGRIFIIFGEPDSIQRQQRLRSQATLEIWTYTELGRRFIFQDYNNDGHFRLVSEG
jgi:GWxTD domain-containing protein